VANRTQEAQAPQIIGRSPSPGGLRDQVHA